MKNKKYDPSKVKLTHYEEAIENSLTDKILKVLTKPVDPDLLKSYKKSAKITLSKMKKSRANIRLNETDLSEIRKIARTRGIPYQTLISSVLHQFITNQLVDVHEVNKLIDAGAFMRK